MRQVLRHWLSSIGQKASRDQRTGNLDACNERVCHASTVAAGLDDVKRAPYTTAMPPRKLTNFRIDADLLEALHKIRERDGLPIAEQIRRAIQAWVSDRGVRKTERSRVRARKRS
jgi:Ribbon-helix-helix protein, copG family